MNQSKSMLIDKTSILSQNLGQNLLFDNVPNFDRTCGLPRLHLPFILSNSKSQCKEKGRCKAKSTWKCGSIALISNIAFKEWGKIFNIER